MKRLFHANVVLFIFCAAAIAGQRTAYASECGPEFDLTDCWCRGTVQNALIGYFVEIGDAARFHILESYTRSGSPAFAVGSDVDIPIPASHGFGEVFVLTSLGGEVWTANSVSHDHTILFLGSPNSTGEGGITKGTACVLPRDASEVAEIVATWVHSCKNEVREALDLPPRDNGCKDEGACSGSRHSRSDDLAVALSICLAAIVGATTSRRKSAGPGGQ